MRFGNRLDAHRRVIIGTGTALCLAAIPVGAMAGTTHTNTGAAGHNRGDVWLDNVSQPAGPGHEMDPHLACQNINLWGAGLADPSGTYTIDGWPPSGSQEQDYPTTGAEPWSYGTAAGGDQVVSVIDVSTLVANAVSHGDAPINKQGFHFKLQFSQDPQKHKTFWVRCGAPAGPAGAPKAPNCYPTKSVTPTGPVASGTLLTYTVTATNNSTVAGPCVLDDVLTTVHATLSKPSAPFNVTAGSIAGSFPSSTWTIPSLGAGTSASFQVTGNATATSAATGRITNTATVTSGCVATAALPCSVAVVTPVSTSPPAAAAIPSLTLTKTVLPAGTVPLGTVLTYTITLTNTSVNDLTPANDPGGVTIDDLMQGTAGFTVDPTSFRGSPTTVTVQTVAPGHYRWNYTTLAAGAAATLTFNATITSGPGAVTSCLLGGAAGHLCLDNTASTSGLAPVTVESLTGPAGSGAGGAGGTGTASSSGSPSSGVQGLSTTTPTTGSFVVRGLAVGSLLMLAGLSLILLALLVRPATGRAASGVSRSVRR